ncbi:MAG: hypothetical protein AAGB34_04815 [Planctomycetota bacterium]
MNQRSIIARFLGDAATAPGPTGVSPFALLGLRKREPDAGEIDRALALRIAEVDRHPQRGSIEAEEVRLALRVAAAQLKNAELRAWFASAPPVVGKSIAYGPSTDPEIDEAVRRAIAVAGGWNNRAMLMLVHSQSVQRAGIDSMKRSLRHLGHRPPARSVPSKSMADPESEDRRTERHLVTARRLALATVGLTVMSVLMVVALGWLVTERLNLSRSLAGGAELLAGERELNDVGAAVDEAAGPTIAAGSPEGIARALVLEITQLGEVLLDDPPGARQVFTQRMDELHSNWLSIPTEQLNEVVEAATAFVNQDLREHPEAGVESLDAMAWAVFESIDPEAESLAINEEELIRLTVSTGLLARLRADRLSRDHSVEIDDALEGQLDVARPSDPGRFFSAKHALPDTFWGGVGLSLEWWSARLSSSSSGDRRDEAWVAWNRTHAALARLSAASADTAVRYSIEGILRSERRESIQEAASEAFRRLGPLFSDAEVLIEWLSDDDLETEKIAAFTSSINWLELGLDEQQPLDAQASLGLRFAYRDRLAALLEGEDSVLLAEDQMSSPWLAFAAEALAEQPQSIEERLEGAVVLAFLSGAAAAEWNGEFKERDDALEQAELVVGGLLKNSSGNSGDVGLEALTSPGSGDDGRWVLEVYSAGRDADRRAVVIRNLLDDGPQGPADADVLAEQAMRGSPVSVRRAAAVVVRAHASNPFVVNGLLEALPDAARQRDVSELIESVTGVTLPHERSSEWRGTAHRALLELLLELLGDPSRTARHRDNAASGLVRSYALWLSMIDDNAAEVVDTDTADPSSIVQLLAAKLLEQGSMVPSGSWALFMPVEIDRRSEGRRLLAPVGVRRFVAEQTAVVEAFGYLVASEQLIRSMDVHEILLEAAEARRRASHVVAQVYANERAIARLWMIRIEVLRHGEAL